MKEQVIKRTASFGNNTISLLNFGSKEAVEQKLDYMHNNSVGTGFIVEPHHWKYSSAVNFAGEPGMIKIDFV